MGLNAGHQAAEAVEQGNRLEQDHGDQAGQKHGQAGADALVQQALAQQGLLALDAGRYLRGEQQGKGEGRILRPLRALNGLRFL